MERRANREQTMTLADLIANARATRTDAQNVRYLDASGTEKVASFATVERANWFRARAAHQGLTVLN